MARDIRTAATMVVDGGFPAADAEIRRALDELVAVWWAERRPEWTDLGWWHADLRDSVRGLLWQRAGPGLAAALADLDDPQLCPVDHGTQRVGHRLLSPGRTPGWPCACQVIVAAAWEACAAWVAARAASSLVEAAGSDPMELDVAGGQRQIRDPASDELAAALRTSPRSMATRVGNARALLDNPVLVRLVESGAISAWAARQVCDHLAGLETQQAAAVVAEVDRRVRSRLDSGRRAFNSAEVNRIARAARLRICPQSEAQQRAEAFSRRRVTVCPLPDGMACLSADLAEVDAHRIHRRLTALAAALATEVPDGRTRDQTRADILVDLLLASPASAEVRAPLAAGETPAVAVQGETPAAAAQDGPPTLAVAAPEAPVPPASGGVPATVPPAQGETPSPSDHGRALSLPAYGGAPTSPAHGEAPCWPASTGAEIQVTVTLPTLLGLADDPAHVPGLGPVPADVARALAADATWRAWITDAAGTVTAVSSRGYVPSPALGRLVRAREQRCRFPGCAQSSAWCDLDHAIPWPRGDTAAWNLGPLCRRHHNLKTHAGWQLDPGRMGQGPARPVASEPDLARTAGDPAGAPPAGWSWRTPAGLTVVDGPDPV